MKDHEKKLELHNKYENHTNLLSTLIRQSNYKYLINILKITIIIWKILGRGEKIYNNLNIIYNVIYKNI